MAFEIAGWRAWYTSGRTFTSRGATFENLPAADAEVLMVFYTERPYREIMHGWPRIVIAGTGARTAAFGSTDPVETILAEYPGALIKESVEPPETVREAAMASREP